jgi:cytoskeletal protein RodZ
MRSLRSEHILLAVLMAVPLAVAFLGWSAFVRWAVGPAPVPTPDVVGASATAQILTASETRAPTVGARPTLVSQPTHVPTVSVAATPAPAVVNTPTPQTPAAGASDPSAAVKEFYARVAAHDFGDAASLWSPRMRAAFPPAQNIDQRFSGTRAVTVQRAQIVSQSAENAVVAVDLDEAASDGQHHWSGTWSVVHGPDGWLLDQPQLQGG